MHVIIFLRLISLTQYEWLFIINRIRILVVVDCFSHVRTICFRVVFACIIYIVYFFTCIVIIIFRLCTNKAKADRLTAMSTFKFPSDHKFFILQGTCWCYTFSFVHILRFHNHLRFVPLLYVNILHTIKLN